MEVLRKRSFTERMLGAARLDVATYEEVEHDSSATVQAAAVVGIVAVCSAIGGPESIVGNLLSVLIGWPLLAGLVYLIGDKLFGGTATWGEMLRTTGFAQAPGVLYILGIIPLLGGIVRFVVWIWVLVAVVVGIRQGLDIGTGKAVATGFLAWLGFAALSLLLSGLV